MYTETDRTQAQAQVQKRWLFTALPSAAVFAIGVALFVLSRLRREEWGWIFACAMTVLSGSYFLFFYGVYLRPARLYAKHIGYMLDGRMREITGVLTEIADTATDKDGLDYYAITVNVGERADPEDDRLLYYDALRGKPALTLGTCVTALSNDRIISDIHEA